MKINILRYSYYDVMFEITFDLFNHIFDYNLKMYDNNCCLSISSDTISIENIFTGYGISLNRNYFYNTSI